MYATASVYVFISFLLWLNISTTSAGKVGECRTECVERNAFKIVRVHLKDTSVNAGVCKNITEGRHAGAAMVTEFVCVLTKGIWDVDLNNEDAVTFFPRPCPGNDPVPAASMADCPGGGSADTV
uniref:Uncharacterized protein n=1 Tax=Plectus sambesii TaxID=2011161 RepID=A0A914X8P1_9BILA